MKANCGRGLLIVMVVTAGGCQVAQPDLDRHLLDAAVPDAGDGHALPQLEDGRERDHEVRKICALLDQGVSPRSIGLEFGVDAKSVRNIDQGKT